MYVLILYAVVAVTEGLVFQPLFMKRRALVPVWASVLTPLVLGLLLQLLARSRFGAAARRCLCLP